MEGFSKMNDCNRIKLCDALGVTNRYTGYRHNLNRGNLDPVRIGYAWLEQQPNQPAYLKWTPEPKWTPPPTKPVNPMCYSSPLTKCEPLNCNQDWSLKKNMEAQLQRVSCKVASEVKADCSVKMTTPPAVQFTQVKCDLNDMPKPGPTNLPISEPPCECDTTFKPLPEFKPQFGCDNTELSVSKPKSETQPTQSLSVTKCVPMARPKSNEKANVPEFSPQFCHCEREKPQVDLSGYIRAPRRECYIKNGGGKKSDLDSWVPPQRSDNCFMPQDPICRKGYNKKTVGLVSPRPIEGIIKDLHVRHSGVPMKKSAPTATIQERCGINTTFPGKTEYKDRYQTPKGPAKTLDFKINPTLDFSIYGRPLDKHGNIPKITEYQYRYEWPDGSKMRSLPWLNA